MTTFQAKIIFKPMASILLIVSLFVSCVGRHNLEPVNPVSGTFSYEIDPSIQPSPDTRPDGKGGTFLLAVSADDADVRSRFIADQVHVIPKNHQELDSFLARHNGTIIGTNAVPEPPARFGIVLDPKYKVPTEYLVRVDPTSFDPKSFTTDATRIGLRGAFRFSSEEGLRLMALITHEKANGSRVSPNYLYEGDGVLLDTQERPGVNAFDMGDFPQFGSTGSKANVTAAWQWVQAHGIVRRTRIAIIDGGFWVDPSGNPRTITCTAGSPPGCIPDGSDLPNAPLQRDIVNGDMFVGDPNPFLCSGGNLCLWHGTGSAGVATGIVNNRAASVGAGGTVADPILFHIDGSFVQARWAIREAVAFGADVITMSFSSSCNNACRDDERDDDAYSDAANAGVVLVASAGNKGIDTGKPNYVHPCINDGVICVGALTDNGNTAFDNRSADEGWASNFGSQVDIWAPTNIVVMPRPDNDSVPPQTIPSGALGTFGGTSASSPFIAGIAAMLKAINPALTSEEVRNRLRDTAWQDSPERETKGVYYVNALEAVKKASNYALPPDRFEGHSSTSLNPGKYEDLNLHSPIDTDSYRFATTGPTFASLKFTYSDALGKVGVINYGLAEDRACGSFEELPGTTQSNQEQVRYRLPLGNFSFTVGGSNKAAPYDLELSLNEAFINSDSFEPNNELALARDLGDGGYVNATLHHPGDVDYYKFFSRGNFRTMVLSMKSGVRVQGADGPIWLDIYNSTGGHYKTVNPAADCSTFAEMTLPEGTWIVRVSGTAAGAYRLWMGSQAEQHPVLEIGSLLYVILNPSGPVEFSVVEKELWLTVEKRSHLPLQELELQTTGLHIRLLTEAGELIAEGRAKDFHGIQGESVLLPQSRSDSHYLVHVTRSLRSSGAAEQRRLATIPALLKMVAGR